MNQFFDFFSGSLPLKDLTLYGPEDAETVFEWPILSPKLLVTYEIKALTTSDPSYSIPSQFFSQKTQKFYAEDNQSLLYFNSKADSYSLVYVTGSIPSSLVKIEKSGEQTQTFQVSLEHPITQFIRAGDNLYVAVMSKLYIFSFNDLSLKSELPFINNIRTISHSDGYLLTVFDDGTIFYIDDNYSYKKSQYFLPVSNWNGFRSTPSHLFKSAFWVSNGIDVFHVFNHQENDTTWRITTDYAISYPIAGLASFPEFPKLVFLADSTHFRILSTSHCSYPHIRHSILGASPHIFTAYGTKHAILLLAANLTDVVITILDKNLTIVTPPQLIDLPNFSTPKPGSPQSFISGASVNFYANVVNLEVSYSSGIVIHTSLALQSFRAKSRVTTSKLDTNNVIHDSTKLFCEIASSQGLAKTPKHTVDLDPPSLPLIDETAVSKQDDPNSIHLTAPRTKRWLDSASLHNSNTDTTITSLDNETYLIPKSWLSTVKDFFSTFVLAKTTEFTEALAAHFNVGFSNQLQALMKTASQQSDTNPQSDKPKKEFLQFSGRLDPPLFNELASFLGSSERSKIGNHKEFFKVVDGTATVPDPVPPQSLSQSINLGFSKLLSPSPAFISPSPQSAFPTPSVSLSQSGLPSQNAFSLFPGQASPSPAADGTGFPVSQSVSLPSQQLSQSMMGFASQSPAPVDGLSQSVPLSQSQSLPPTKPASSGKTAAPAKKPKKSKSKLGF